MTDRSEAVAALCPTCGSAVRVVSNDEGTSYYEPVATLRPEREELREALEEVATRASALLAVARNDEANPYGFLMFDLDKALVELDQALAAPSVPSIDAVWAQAEAAFGGHEADWRVLFWPGIEGFYAELTLNEPGEDGRRVVDFARADTPAAALLALADRLGSE